MAPTTSTSATWLARSFDRNEMFIQVCPPRTGFSSASLRRIRSSGSCCVAEAIAEAMNRIDRIAVRAEALAEPSDVRVDGSRVRLGADTPDLLQELGPGEHAARMLDEDREELVLERSEAELGTI